MKKLIPVIVQNAYTGKVLMQAYMDRKAIEMSIETGYMHYWSRSKKRIWMKGETSGNKQKVVSLTWDCDNDSILAGVIPAGPSCHTGKESCFYNTFYGKEKEHFIYELYEIIKNRKENPVSDSYTNKLLSDINLIKRKIIEEAVEVTDTRNKKELIHEACDLLYHLLVFLCYNKVPLKNVERELKKRHMAKR